MPKHNEVRIIGGQWKGRKLRFPARPGLRPTLGRVRETLFNWLAADIAGARCLDLFAGSGALGIEALSRGAGEVTFVEKDRKAAESLRMNLSALGVPADRATVRQQSAAAYVRDASRHDPVFDIVFFDPPFQDPRAPALLEALLTLLAPDGLIYLERDRRASLPSGGRLVKEGRAGDCRFGLVRAAPPDGPKP